MPDPPIRELTTHCHGPSIAMPAPPSSSVISLEAGVVEAWYAPLAALHDRAAYFHDLLDPVELERAARFRFHHDRDRFILGHGLLRSLLGHYLKRDGSLVRMARGPFGKPFLERKALRFNLSDTKDAVLIAFATDLEIGADIETMTRDVDHHAVSEHYFTPPEVQAITEAGSDGKRRFLELWTRKEAVLKASGVGIMDDLKALRVDAPRNTMLIAHEAFARMAAPTYHVHTYHVGAEHLISIASPKPLKAVRLWDAAAGL
ncbi:MAG: 4'-phosphopantetheinyl transferase superfamily protein [Flavobacteriales bacterium]